MQTTLPTVMDSCFTPTTVEALPSNLLESWACIMASFLSLNGNIPLYNGCKHKTHTENSNLYTVTTHQNLVNARYSNSLSVAPFMAILQFRVIILLSISEFTKTTCKKAPVCKHLYSQDLPPKHFATLSEHSCEQLTHVQLHHTLPTQFREDLGWVFQLSTNRSNTIIHPRRHLWPHPHPSKP